MLGFASAESDQFTDQSATATLAMRQACKNILYTVGNSGYYAEGDPSGKPDRMTTMFNNANIGVAALVGALEAVLSKQGSQSSILRQRFRASHVSEHLMFQGSSSGSLFRIAEKSMLHFPSEM